MGILCGFEVFIYHAKLVLSMKNKFITLLSPCNYRGLYVICTITHSKEHWFIVYHHDFYMDRCTRLCRQLPSVTYKCVLTSLGIIRQLCQDVLSGSALSNARRTLHNTNMLPCLAGSFFRIWQAMHCTNMHNSQPIREQENRRHMVRQSWGWATSSCLEWWWEGVMVVMTWVNQSDIILWLEIIFFQTWPTLQVWTGHCQNCYRVLAIYYATNMTLWLLILSQKTLSYFM